MKLGDFGLAIDANIERPKSRVGTLGELFGGCGIRRDSRLKAEEQCVLCVSSNDQPADSPPSPLTRTDYMSPEVVSLPTADERKKMEQAGKPVPEAPVYTEKVDIWAAGILAYELLIGKPPYEVQNEVETRKRIMQETTLTFPPHVSADAISFIKTALAKNASVRPDAAGLLRHPWIRPHLVAAIAAGGGAAGALLAGDGKAAAIAALKNPSPNATTMERSASLTGAVRPTGLAVPPSSLGDELADNYLMSLLTKAAAANSSHGGSSSLTTSPVKGSTRPPLASPTASDVPATPGPWLGGRKPIWEADRSPITAQTTDLSGNASAFGCSPHSPSSTASTTTPTTSPGRSKLGGGPGALAAAGGPGSPGSGCNPLLKAALNSSLYKISHATQQGAGAAAPVTSVANSTASSNVKMRIKDYFVARSNNNEATNGGGTLT